MDSTQTYTAEAPGLQEVQRTRGPLVLEFGTAWCGHCRAAQPYINEAFSSDPELPHRKIEDGKGRPLGRAFGVKQWPGSNTAEPDWLRTWCGGAATGAQWH